MFLSLLVALAGAITFAAHSWYDEAGRDLFDATPKKPPKGCTVNIWIEQPITIRRTYRRLALKRMMK